MVETKIKRRKSIEREINGILRNVGSDKVLYCLVVADQDSTELRQVSIKFPNDEVDPELEDAEDGVIIKPNETLKDKKDLSDLKQTYIG